MKWVLIIVGGLVGLLILIGGVGYYFLSKPMDPNSAMGQEYAQSFKASFIESCAQQAQAAAGSDPEMVQKIQTACECGADASYLELKDVPVTEQFSRMQDPEMQQKIGAIMQTCMQNAGLQ